MIRRPQLDIIGLHGCILKLTIKIYGKESGLSEADLDQLNGKTLTQLDKGNVVGALLTVTVGYTNCCM